MLGESASATIEINSTYHQTPSKNAQRKKIDRNKKRKKN